MKRIASIIITSFIIGNVISWAMGSWPITFAPQAYTAQERSSIQTLKQELVNTPSDVAVLVELGALYSMHNDIDIAADYLSQAISFAPNDPLAIAWFSANSAKLSGASLDFSMGIYKLYTLNKALEGISKAVDLAPDDLTIRLVRLATFANVGAINPQFELVFTDERWFEQLLAKVSDNIPEQVKGQFYLSMVQAYFVKADALAATKIEKYLKLYQHINNKTPQDQAQEQILATKFIVLERGTTWK